MDKLKLIEPTMEYADEILSYRQEFLDCGDSMDGSSSLIKFERVEDWLEKVERYKHGETVPPEKVTAIQLICIRESDDKLVGMINVRHTLNDYLRDFGGHIGYSVRPSERRKGYAAWMLQNALPYCKSIGIDDVLLACLVNNEGSRRTILRNGGVYAETVHEPKEDVLLEKYWIHI